MHGTADSIINEYQRWQCPQLMGHRDHVKIRQSKGCDNCCTTQ